jgi:peptidoglycan L-alanyl-D-glutamate endopeptidase CwlK
MDQQSISELQSLHPKVRDIAILAYTQAVKATPVGIHPLITQGYRTFAESEALYNQGRTTPGSIVSNAKAGQSYHNYGLAVDMCLVINGKQSWEVDTNWMIVVNIFKQHKFTWGGDFAGSFKDYPHLEMKFGHNWRDLLVLHDTGKFIPGTTYVQI